jgi:hypothetical protein
MTDTDIRRPNFTPLDPNNPSENALEQRARRAARRVALMAKKSRWRLGTIDNYGAFALVDPRTNFMVAGFRYDLSAEGVIEYCNGE